MRPTQDCKSYLFNELQIYKLASISFLRVSLMVNVKVGVEPQVTAKQFCSKL